MELLKIKLEVLKFLFAIASPCFAAFFGAYMAFRFQNKREKEKEENLNVNSINKELFRLIRLKSKFLNLNTNVEKYKTHPLRYILLQPLLFQNDENTLIQFKNLEIFLSDEDSVNALYQVSAFQEYVTNTIWILNRRNEIQSNYIQSVISENQITEFDQPHEFWEARLGRKIFSEQVQLTNDLYERAEKLVSYIDEVHQLIFKTAKKHFPNRIFYQAAHEKIDERELAD